MKIQDGVSKPTTTLRKQTLGSGSNFKEKMPSYINEINLSNSIFVQQDSPITQPLGIIKKIHFNTNMNQLRSEVSTLLETSTKLYLFLGRTMMENYSEIIVYEYLRADGSHKSMEMNGVKGEITCLKARFCQKIKKLSGQKSESIKNTKKSSSLKNGKQGTYEIVLLIGTIKGYLKTLRFGDTQSLQDGRMQLHSIKLDYCQIVTVIALQPEYYNGAKVCLVLSLTNRVYLVNFDSMNLIALYMPTIVSCEVGLGLSVNQEQQYFIQTCQGGYIIFWDINEHVLQLIKKSAGGQTDTLRQGFSMQKQQTPHTNCIPGTFHASDIHHSISPLSIFHSATILGLKYCQLYGNMLLLITQGGLLKLLAINKSTNTHVNQNEYCSLIEYQIEDGELVSDVRFYPETREVFVVKSEILAGVNVRNGLEKYLPVREFNVEKQAQKKKNGKTQYLKPYKPKVLKSSQNNIIPERNRSFQNHHNRCYFERIVFNSQLQIETVDKVYPQHKIDSIESLEMVEGKDIILLRAREFYLIGSTDSFKVVDLS